MAAASSSQGQEWVIQVPKVNPMKSYSLLRFNKSLDVDVSQWSDVTMQRENNRTVYEYEEDKQAFGEGSEYNKANRMEARRKKMGYKVRSYNHDAQPWLLNVQGNRERKFRGMKDGGAGEHADFWVFAKSGDGVFHAHKIHDWYSFMPVVRHKTLDIDQAEEQFVKRNKILNQFALKAQLMSGEREEEVVEQVSSSGKVKKLKVTSQDDLLDDSDSDQDEDDEEGNSKQKKKSNLDDSDDEPAKKKKKAAKKRGKPKKSHFNEEEGIAVPDSDDGDEEGEEVDYMSDSEASDMEVTAADEKKIEEALVGVGDERGLRTLLSDEEEDEEDEEQRNKTTTTNLSTDERKERRDSESGSDSDDPDEVNVKSAVFMPDKETKMEEEEAEAGSSAATKRKAANDDTQPDSKKSKVDKSDGSDDGLTEMGVRRYLLRKPHSTKELIAKFKAKCQGMTKDQIVKKLALILQKLNPSQEKRGDALYFSLKL